MQQDEMPGCSQTTTYTPGSAALPLCCLLLQWSSPVWHCWPTVQPVRCCRGVALRPAAPRYSKVYRIMPSSRVASSAWMQGWHGSLAQGITMNDNNSWSRNIEPCDAALCWMHSAACLLWDDNVPALPQALPHNFVLLGREEPQADTTRIMWF
jgi:hypothetical protein